MNTQQTSEAMDAATRSSVGRADADRRLRAESERWWQGTKRDPAALSLWLQSQLRGERSAAERIAALRDRYAAPGGEAHRALGVIAAQERRHADWVAGLLARRGLSPEPEPAAERYWPRVIPGVRDLATGAAVGAHAERMRLFRIIAIAEDAEAPDDIRAVFARIWPEERFHERAFRRIAGPAALAETAAGHEAGARALGLLP